MSDRAAPMIDWDVIDESRIKGMREQPLSDVLAKLAGPGQSTPEEHADELVDLAVKGKIMPMKDQTALLRQWASENGLRRIENTLIELERVLSLDARGQAILQAQALTRFLRLHIAADVQHLSDAISRSKR